MDLHIHIDKRTAIVVITAVIAGAIAGGLAGAAASHEGREHELGGRMGARGYEGSMQDDQSYGNAGNEYYTSSASATAPAPAAVSVPVVPVTQITK